MLRSRRPSPSLTTLQHTHQNVRTNRRRPLPNPGDLSPRLLYHPAATRIAIPLPRGPTKQHPIQPSHTILLPEILGFHARWFLGAIRHRSLANVQEPIDGVRREGGLRRLLRLSETQRGTDQGAVA